VIIRQYETMMLLAPELDEAGCDGIVDFVKELAKKDKITIASADYLGKKTLAYQIGQNKEAHYYLLTFDSSPSFVAELERNLKINDKVIRFLTVKRPLRAKPFQKGMEEKAAVSETKKETEPVETAETGEDEDAGN
jgi:small subunit ribosomal protein S6